jgi:hypothetical protein
MAVIIFDNGGRRLGFERRQFSYLIHIPERRSGRDRRRRRDRRHEPGTELDKEKERRWIFQK